MRLPVVLLGAVLLAGGLLLVSAAGEQNARAAAHDPTADTATGSVRILSRGDPTLALPQNLHRGASYVVYDRTFEARAIPDDVVAVEFGVHFTLAPEGAVPYPWSDRFLPAKESYSGAHLQGSPWVRPYAPEVHALEATRTFTKVGETWRAKLVLDTDDLPSDASRFDYVVGSFYVAHLADGTVRDLQGLAGAGKEHTLVVQEGGFVAVALQKAGAWLGAPLAVFGFAATAWGATRR